MARPARGDDIRAAALGDRVETTIDLREHSHHLTRHELVALLITREIELLERLPLAPDMTELTTDAEVAGEIPHCPDDVDHRRRLGNHLRVDQGVGGKFASRLRTELRSARKHEEEEESPHRCRVKVC